MGHKVCSYPASRPGLILAFVLAFASVALAAQWKEQVLYSFQGGNDGQTPAGGVVFDKAGNLYGTVTYGGQYGEGDVFELSPRAKKGGPWTESIIYSFLGKGQNDGMNPWGSVVIDAAGNLYGTTAYGGTGGCILLGILYGCGTVYELSPPKQKGGQWTETIVYSFQSGNDGYYPWGSLTFDKAGNLYGATQFGGGKGNTCDVYYGGNCGTVFKLSPPKQKGGTWTEQVLHRFAGGTDGATPNGGLILDKQGAAYGTTPYGGAGNCQGEAEVGCGTVFKMKPPARKGGAWVEEVLHRFLGGSKDTNTPDSGPVWDRQGNLYGTTYGGNNSNGDDGAVFKLAPPAKRGGQWKETFPLDFKQCTEDYGCAPSNLILDSTGNLYVTTAVIFRMAPPRRRGGHWTLSLVYKFKGAPDGYDPIALILHGVNTIYGTTLNGGTGTTCQGGCGTVFEVSR